MPSRRSRPPEQPEIERARFLLETDEAAFLAGSAGGEAIRRIAEASATTIKAGDRFRYLDIFGDALSRMRAEKYVDFVINQMDGVFRVDDSDLNNDCSIVEVPGSVVGFVTGKHGSFLRQLEKKWGVIMFFAQYDGRLNKPFQALRTGDHAETLLIFGRRRFRRGAQLTVMGAVEDNVPGYYSDATRERGEMFEGQFCRTSDSADWGTTTMEVEDKLVPYAVGKKGSTLTKLMQASGALVQYINNLAYFSGSEKQQKRAGEYLTWLLDALEGPIQVNNVHRRSDATAVMVPASEVGFITGAKRIGLSRMEEEWGVLMVFEGEHGQRAEAIPDEFVTLLIFGECARSRKGAELDTMCSIEFKQKGFCTKNLENRGSEKEGFDMEYWEMSEVEVSFCLGSGGQTRRKVANASGAILQFVGLFCCIGGTRAERRRCWDYLQWLMHQMTKSPDAFIDTRGHEDVTEVELKGLMNKAVGVVTGRNGNRLRNIEKETGTLCFVAKNHMGMERLCICSHDAGSRNGDSGRKKAERLFRDALHEASVIQQYKGRPRVQQWQNGNGYPKSYNNNNWSSDYYWNDNRGSWNSWDSPQWSRDRSWDSSYSRRPGLRKKDKYPRSKSNQGMHRDWDV